MIFFIKLFIKLQDKSSPIQKH